MWCYDYAHVEARSIRNLNAVRLRLDMDDFGSSPSKRCNACGVAWRLKKPKGEPDLVMVEAPMTQSDAAASGPRLEEDKNIVIRSSSGGAMVYSRRNEVTGKMEDIYHCKFWYDFILMARDGFFFFFPTPIPLIISLPS